ncbi:recombinase family protein [Mediterraneibacter gnavus]|uniref:recombinase family protein n=1 Tax=Mediterraneibacter gnavus TaxID=33038 RepID=UPI0035693537
MYQMAAYCRLSKDDGENKMSESIENQMKLIREYVSKSEDLEIVDVYIDDGYSGLYFANRPEFQRMMEDIYKGKIQGVITKDISRLGREHIETSNYIERVFPSLNIRYIAILDGVDSLAHSNEELAQFKTLFNDMYSRDISKKIKGSLTAQKKRGQFMSGFAPYGYMKDPKDKHHFVVDEEAANVVRRIFNLYLSGYSRDGIAKILNEEGILPPSEYKRKVQGLNYTNAHEKAGAKGWAYPTVNVILRNRTYTGAMVQHKSEKISYKVEKYRYIPKEEQYIVENMHEPIVSMDTFEQAQALMTKRTRTPGFWSESKKVNPYAGILVCENCGYNLQRVTCRDGYECGSYHKKGNTFCCSHFIKKEILDDIVKLEIERQAKLALKESDKDELLKAADRRKETERRCEEADKKIERLKEELSTVQKYKKKTYENFVDGILNKEEYLSYKAEYEQQEKSVRSKMEQAELEKESFGGAEEEHEHWMEKFIKYGSLEEVTREIVVELIDKIVIHSDMSMDIIFKYQSPYVEAV